MAVVMMTSRRWLAAIGILFGVGTILASVTTSRAAIILANDGAFGAGIDEFNLTQDTTSELEWLDLTLTLNKSYDDVVDGDPFGYIAAGFTVATTSQVATFFTNAGADNLVGTFSNAQFSAADFLLSALGCTATSCDGFDSFSEGWALDSGDASKVIRYFVDTRSSFSLGDEGAFGSVGSSFGLTASSLTSGVWLVRTFSPAAVPEPSTLALFAFGLAGLGFVTRRRRTGVGIGKTRHAS